MDIKKLIKVADSTKETSARVPKTTRVEDVGNETKYSAEELIKNPPKWVQDKWKWETVVNRATHNGEKKVAIVVPLKMYKASLQARSKDDEENIKEMKERRRKMHEIPDNVEPKYRSMTQEDTTKIKVIDSVSEVLDRIYENIIAKPENKDMFFEVYTTMHETPAEKASETLKELFKKWEVEEDDVLYDYADDLEKAVKDFQERQIEDSVKSMETWDKMSMGEKVRYVMTALKTEDNDYAQEIAGKSFEELPEELKEGFPKEVKDDSGEEQYDRGVKAGEQAIAKEWDYDQTKKYYEELQKQFLKGIAQAYGKVSDSAEFLKDWSVANSKFELYRDDYGFYLRHIHPDGETNCKFVADEGTYIIIGGAGDLAEDLKKKNAGAECIAEDKIIPLIELFVHFVELRDATLCPEASVPIVQVVEEPAPVVEVTEQVVEEQVE